MNVDTLCTECQLPIIEQPGSIVFDDNGNAYCCHSCRGAALECLEHWRGTPEIREIFEQVRAA